MANRWGKVETVTDFMFLGSKITADSDCSHGIRRHLLLGMKAMANLDSVLKSRHHFADEGPYSQGYGFPCNRVMDVRVEPHKSIKNANGQRINTFELWCWKRLLSVPWTARRSNQSILKEISPKYSLEGLMLKLKLQYFGHLMQRADSWEKTDAGKGRIEEGDRGWDSWMASLSQYTWVWANSWRQCEGQGNLACCSQWRHKELGKT